MKSGVLTYLDDVSRVPHDEVDQIVSAWILQRPDLDVRPMHVLSRVSRLARYLDLKRRDVFAAHQLEPWEFDVLASLRRAGTPYALTPGALMNELLVSSGTMTNRVDRLESRGLVSRSPSPDDRRAVLVSLTPLGQQVVDEALAGLLECEQEILAPLSDEQRQNLSELLRQILTAIE